MKNLFFALFFVVFISCDKKAEQLVYEEQSIIPAPVSYKNINSEFRIDKNFSINLQTDNKQVKVYTNDFIKYLDKVEIKSSLNKTGNLIVKLNQTTDSVIGSEGYTLDVNDKHILITAHQAPGVFNAFQTLKQLISIQKDTLTSFTIQGCKIVDYPRFKWRGLMLDVSRHFFTVDEVKMYLDKMSEYKFNVFHWHLTDDQGWRIEIKSLPKLTEIGAWRVERYGKFGSGRPFPKKGEKATYGGFYTHGQIKEIVQYAKDRNITIVPEIDMPGHSMAALAAYPELSVNKKPTFVIPGSKFSNWFGGGKFEMTIENTLNPIDEKVYEFIDKIFTEIAELFPGEYIHMGGDEAYHGYWMKNREVRQFMKQNNISTSDELQSYFVKRVEKIITNKGKKMIGWDEILQGGLAKSAAVMSWRGMKGGIKAAGMNHNVVMTPTTFAYLDYTQGDISVENKIYASLSLEKTYEFEPVPEEVDAKYILGGQGNLWTESVATMPFAFYMTYPRAFALSETFWSEKNKKDWDAFIRRTEVHFKRFEKEKLNISKAVLDPIISVYKEENVLMCKLENHMPGTDIFYTIDNTYPVKFGLKYTKPFSIPQGNLSLRTQTFRNGKAISRQLLVSRKDLVKRAK